MVEVNSNKPVTLGGMVLLAQKRAREAMARQAVTASLTNDRLSDVVQISAEARQRLDKARRVSSYLEDFRAFLKLINSRS